MTTNKTTDFELNYIKENKDTKLEQPNDTVVEKWSFIMGFVVGIGIWCWYTFFKIIF
jgi:hypothetical protein